VAPPYRPANRRQNPPYCHRFLERLNMMNVHSEGRERAGKEKRRERSEKWMGKPVFPLFIRYTEPVRFTWIRPVQFTSLSPAPWNSLRPSLFFFSIHAPPYSLFAPPSPFIFVLFACILIFFILTPHSYFRLSYAYLFISFILQGY